MVVFVIGDKKALVVDEKLANSKLISGLIKDSGPNPSINIPEKYWSVAGNYINFLHDKPTTITDPVKLQLCFNMSNYFLDNKYFQYLVLQAYSIWDEFLPYIHDLPSEVQYNIYLDTPYEYLSHWFLNIIIFIKQWSHNHSHIYSHIYNHNLVKIFLSCFLLFCFFLFCFFFCCFFLFCFFFFCFLSFCFLFFCFLFFCFLSFCFLSFSFISFLLSKKWWSSSSEIRKPSSPTEN